MARTLYIVSRGMMCKATRIEAPIPQEHGARCRVNTTDAAGCQAQTTGRRPHPSFPEWDGNPPALLLFPDRHWPRLLIPCGGSSHRFLAGTGYGTFVSHRLHSRPVTRHEVGA